MNQPGKLIRACYYFNYLNLLSIVILPFIVTAMGVSVTSQPPMVVSAIRTIFLIPSLILWIYCLVFCYSNDRYSKAGLWLLFFNVIYGAYYFHNVIWKRKRELINTIEHEPVLGNKIHIESEEDEN